MTTNPAIQKLTEETKRVFGNEEQALQWLSNPNHALGGKISPLEHAAASEQGLKAVQDLLVCNDYGIYL